MAAKQLTREDLQKLNKTELQDIAKQFEINVKGLTKEQLGDWIISAAAGALPKAKADIPTQADEEETTDIRYHSPTDNPKLQSFELDENVSERVAIRKLELEERKLELEQRKLEFEHRKLEVQREGERS